MGHFGYSANFTVNSTKVHTCTWPSLFLCFALQYNAVYDIAVSADEAGIVEYWSGIKHDLQFPKNVDFEFKTDTDLFEFIMVIMLICCGKYGNLL